MRYVVTVGDVMETCGGFEAGSFDGCLCDPPYGLSFMGKKWDYDVPSVETWGAVLATLKPGSHLLAFAGTRTQHRMAVRIEDAGFEIRDMIAWVYGSGFPKSLDVSKAIDKAAGAEREVVGVRSTFRPNAPQNASDADPKAWQDRSDGKETIPATDAARQWSGYGTALKPALEPITVARKPLVGTVAANVLAFGTGAINVDACRIEHTPGDEGEWGAKNTGNTRGVYGAFADEAGLPGSTRNPAGRWPANLIHDGSEEVLAGFPESKSTANVRHNGAFKSVAKGAETERDSFGHSDSGSTARFFYCAKASRSEREAGLREAGLREAVSGAYGEFAGDGRGRQTEHRPAANHHPTVKPLALCEYLARLILPPKRDTPRRLLVPFSGSGSEIIGALRAGWDEVVGIELSPEYAEIAKARIAHWIAGQQELAL